MGARSFSNLQTYAEVLSPRTELRSAEWVAIVYFSYSAALSLSRGIGMERVVVALCMPLLIWMLAASETAYSKPWSRVCRALIPTVLILAAYWQVEWFTASPLGGFQTMCAAWDREILTTWGLHGSVEALGPVGPWLLDISYMLLYTVPPVCVAVLFASGHGHRVDTFLTTMLMGTFAVYALLPHFPTLAPRVAFAGQLLPEITSPVRQFNLFVLDHMDISTSVFPSGHVAVAFSSAFGMLRAMPRLRWPAMALGVYASLVFVATIYGRYHYAADGLASIVLSVAAWRISERLPLLFVRQPLPDSRGSYGV